MPKFGGPGRKKKRCLARNCTPGGTQESVAKGFSIQISHSDINTLLIPLNWLNDQVPTGLLHYSKA